MSSNRCEKCGSGAVRWTTMRRNVPVDVLQCQDCGTTLVEEDWMVPVLPLVEGRCINCGDTNIDGACRNCGLSREEDVQVHDELRQMVAPQHNLLNAAREASRQGRRLMALKLTTAAAVLDTEGQREIARALRIWLLSAIGESMSALEDAKAWVENDPDPPAVAWASYGQQQQHAGMPGAAADAYRKALAKDPEQHPIRAQRAAMLIAMGREGQGSEEACAVLETQVDDRTAEVALGVVEKLCEKHFGRALDNEIERLLDRCAAYVDRSAALLAHRARLAAANGDTTAARRDMKLAKRLQKDHPLYAEVEEAIKPHRTSWWRW